jgi:hypothetical protein
MKVKLRDSSAKNTEERDNGAVVAEVRDNDYLQKLVASMTERLAEVIHKEGWTTHY